MGYNLLSGSITLSQTGSIQVTGSFRGSLEGRVTENSDVPHTTVYTFSNAGADRLITSNDGSGESFNGEESLTFSSADQTLTIVGHDSADTTAVLISGSTSNDSLLRVKSNTVDHAFVVRGNGNVGIGTTNPSRALQVTSAENELIRLDNTQAGGDCVINYRTSHGADVNWAAGIKGSDDSFRISNSTNVGTNDRLVVDSTGKVGVNTDTPISEFDVAGKIAITAESTTPSAPSDGQGYLYSKSDGKLYWRSFDLAETDLTVGTGASNSFQTIAVSGQSDVVADSSTDTLTLVAGSNITLTTDAAGDQITIASSGGGGGSGSGIFTEIDGDEAFVTSSLTIGGNSNPTHTLTLIGNSHLSGGVCHNRLHTTENYTITVADYYVGVDTSSNPVTLTLPAANSTTSGQTFVIKDEGGAAQSNNITVHISIEGNTIDGGHALVLESPYAAVSIYSNGLTGYFVY